MTRMNRRFAPLAAMLLSISACADGITFKVELVGGKIYRTTTEMVSDSKISYESDSSTLAILRSKGVQSPMFTRQTQTIVMKTATGEKRPGGEIPFTTTVDSVQFGQFLNGVFQQQAAPPGFDSSMYFSGFYSKDSLMILELKSEIIPPSMLPSLKSSLTQMMKSVKFPDKPLAEGDEFIQSVPLAMPIPGGVGMNFEIVTTYKLREIRPNQAYFDITQEYRINGSSVNPKFTMNGSGEGNLIYDTKLNYITSMTTISNMKTRTDEGQFSILVEADTRTDLSTEISDAKTNSSPRK